MAYKMETEAFKTQSEGTLLLRIRWQQVSETSSCQSRRTNPADIYHTALFSISMIKTTKTKTLDPVWTSLQEFLTRAPDVTSALSTMALGESLITGWPWSWGSEEGAPRCSAPTDPTGADRPERRGGTGTWGSRQERNSAVHHPAADAANRHPWFQNIHHPSDSTFPGPERITGALRNHVS